MYPSPPDFRSPAPGSAWVTVSVPGGITVYASQWDTLVRLFQQKARDLLSPMVLYGRLSSGQCNTTGLARWRDAWNVVAGSTNLRRVDQITVDGRWGPEAADALWTLLCLTGQTERARETHVAIEAQNITAEMVRQMIWFALFVTAVDSAAAPGSVNYRSTVDGHNLEISPQAILPLWTTVVASAPEDAVWVASYPSTGQMPRAPSQANPPASPVVAPQSGISTPVPWYWALGVVALVGGVTWYVTAPQTGAR